MPPEDDNTFHILIEGTGLTESILAAAAAWAGKRVLHVDKNAFYGSHWAALSIDQLDTWVQNNSSSENTPYSSATLNRLPISSLSYPSPLQASRAYSLDLSPHLLYCSSELVRCLANSKLSQYLEFKALEHIYIYQSDGDRGEPSLQNVPSSREHIFASTLSLQEKRKLMKFLNYALSEESDEVSGTLEELLMSTEYNLPESLRNTIQYAIALSPTPDMNAADGLRAIQRHLTGFGVYGAFPIIVPLHGGGGELSQAFCRAAAVKGATYILGRQIREVLHDTTTQDFPFNVEFDVSDSEELRNVRCKRVVRLDRPEGSECVQITQTVTVVEGIVNELFDLDMQHADAALIVIPPGVLSPTQMPVQIIVHGGGIGECPQGQWVIYCSTQAGGAAALEVCSRAQTAIFEQITGKRGTVEPLLQLKYQYVAPTTTHVPETNQVVLVNPPVASHDYDHAYLEAKRLFEQMFGEDTDFLIPTEDDNEVEEEYLN